MADSSSFSKLSDLIDSHLSNIQTQASSSGNKMDELIRNAYASDKCGNPSSYVIQPLNPRVVLPSLNQSQNKKPSSILNVMAKQVSNAIKVRDSKQNQMEIDKYETMDSQKDDELIDLMKCLIVPDVSSIVQRKNSTKNENDLKKQIIMEDICDVNQKLPNLKHRELRCVLRESNNKMSKINRRRKRARCSSLGKAICARFVQFYEPCRLREIDTTIMRFDFREMSPDDLVKESLKPRTYKNISNN